MHTLLLLICANPLQELGQGLTADLQHGWTDSHGANTWISVRNTGMGLEKRPQGREEFSGADVLVLGAGNKHSIAQPWD